MGDNEKLEKWLSEHEGEDFCQYCIYDCEHPGVSGGPNGPIYPPCAERDVTEYLDTDAILQDIMEEERNEGY